MEAEGRCVPHSTTVRKASAEHESPREPASRGPMRNGDMPMMWPERRQIEAESCAVP